MFQVALFSDEDREHYVQAIAQKAEGERRPIVFEGHEPAAIEACDPLAQLLAAPDWPAVGKGTEVWLGEPVAIKAPTSVRFRRQGGSNLLIVTREEEQGVGLLSACVLGLAAQHRPETAKLYLVDLASADGPGRTLPATWPTCCRIGSKCSDGVTSPGCSRSSQARSSGVSMGGPAPRIGTAT